MRIFISVAEDSADLHAAALVRAARTHLPQASFFGLTGPRLRGEGVETVFDMASHAAMLGAVVKLLGRGRAALRAAEDSWRRSPPNLVVVMDSTALHLPMARRAKRMGLPVLYYIAPQTWASRAGRNEALARDVDRVACILPFEEQWFRAAGVNATFVGHPLFESLARQTPDAERVEELRRFALGAPLIALLPGSRAHVVDRVLPIQLEIVDRLRHCGQRVAVAVSAASETRAGQIRSLLRTASAQRAQTTAASPEPISAEPPRIESDTASLLSAADLVLVASGTATLEVAYYRKPMIVLYDAGRPLSTLYPWFGRWVVRTPHLALVNILADARIVPEFMPAVPDPARVARVAGQLLHDAGWRRQMASQLDSVVRPLESSRASMRVCEIIAETAAKRSGARPARHVAEP